MQVCKGQGGQFCNNIQVYRFRKVSSVTVYRCVEVEEGQFYNSVQVYRFREVSSVTGYRCA